MSLKRSGSFVQTWRTWRNRDNSRIPRSVLCAAIARQWDFAVENIRAPVDELPPPIEVDGYAIRRVTSADRASLLGWIAAKFAPVWAFEVARALDGPRRAVHAAWRAGTPVAFAAADGNNQGLGWFGPAGTDPAHRSKRLGESLLLRCLADVRGLPEGGVIAWIGPKGFYAKACGAADDRRFVTLERS